MYLLDTNICIALLKGKEQLLSDRLARETPKSFIIPSIVRAELYYGARKSARVTENLAALGAFLYPFPTLVFDDRAAEHYGSIRAHLAAVGTPIGGNDLFIAAMALSEDLTVVTRNRSEFQRVPALRLEVW